MRLDDIKARAAAATPGPWLKSGTAERPHWYVYSPEVLIHGPALHALWDTEQSTIDRWIADAEYIAHSRDDIDWLVARVEELSAALRNVCSDCGWCDADFDARVTALRKLEDAP